MDGAFKELDEYAFLTARSVNNKKLRRINAGAFCCLIPLGRPSHEQICLQNPGLITDRFSLFLDQINQ